MNHAIFLAFSLQLSHRHSRPAADPWLGPDKIEHFVVGMFAQSLCYGTIRVAGGSKSVAMLGATAGTAGLATWKELRDRSGKGDPSIKDFAWTLAGGGAASVLLAQTPR